MCKLFLLILFIWPINAMAEKSRPPTLPQAHKPARAGAQTLERIRRRVQARLNKLRAVAGFPGANVGIILPDGRAVSVSTGFSNVEDKTPLVSSDLMLAGSVGKTFVAAVMLQLAQEGKVELDQKIAHWFARESWFKRLPNATEITLRMLMNHTGGLPNHVDDDDKFLKALIANPNQPCRPEELVAIILDQQPLFPAGKGWYYTDTSYILIGMIIEKVTGQTLYDEVARRILKPYKLNHTIPQQGRVIPGVIQGYTSLPGVGDAQGRMIAQGKFILNPQCEWAGGGFASTAEDLARWARILYQGKVLKKRYREQMLSGVKAADEERYGLGVEIGEGKWGRVYGHDGLFPGYVSAMEYFPRHRIAVGIQFNTDSPTMLKQDPGEYIDDIMSIITTEAKRLN